MAGLKGLDGVRRLAVCVSGGLDSAILLGLAARRAVEVHPLFIANGHPWEDAEFEALKNFSRALNHPAIQKPVKLELPVRSWLERYWGPKTYHPGYEQGYSANYIPGRNVALLPPAAFYALGHSLPVIALGIMAHNPYPDAQPAFLRAFERMIRIGMKFKLRIILPLSHLDKTEIVRLGRGLPLKHTFSCAGPVNGLHCGNACNKCAERQKAFALAGVPDLTRYARVPPKVDWVTHEWPD